MTNFQVKTGVHVGICVRMLVIISTIAYVFGLVNWYVFIDVHWS